MLWVWLQVLVTDHQSDCSIAHWNKTVEVMTTNYTKVRMYYCMCITVYVLLYAVTVEGVMDYVVRLLRTQFSDGKILTDSILGHLY